MRYQSVSRLTGLVLAAVTLASMGGCASRPPGLMQPVAASAPGATAVPLLVATTRRSNADPGVLFSGERGRYTSYADITMSIPPTHVTGEIEWPRRAPGDPARDFVPLQVDSINRAGFLAAVRKQIAQKRERRVLVFVHGYNTLFDDSVYRFAQIQYDSGAPVVPVLFTWPSRGRLLSYPFDRESANYSRDALEGLLKDLASEPSVGEVVVLAHSMGNWVTLEALRQMAIRDRGVSTKIKDVMLAAPDVDVEVARTQIEAMGEKRPNFTLFVSADDKALKFSNAVWGSTARLGQINPMQEPYRTALERFRIKTVDLSGINDGDSLNHAKFAQSPEVVRFIGSRLAAGQTIGERHAGLGDQIGLVVSGAASTVVQAATLVVSAPIAIIDPNTRHNLTDRVGTLVPQQDDGSELTHLSQEAAPAAAGKKRPKQP